MKRPALVKTIVITLAVLLIGLGVWLFSGDKDKDANGALNTATVGRGNIEAVVTAQGKLEPKEYVDVGAEVSGQIKKLHVDYGSVVKQGDLIAEIDPASYEAAVKGDEARIKQLEAQLQQQDAAIKQAEQKRDRNKTLYESKAVSQELYQDAMTALQIANAQYLSLEAQMEEAQSLLEGDQADLDRTKIYAPMDGTIVSLSIKEGQTINANQTTPVIAQVAKLDVMTVRAQVAEADISKLTPKMPVYFTTLGSQGRKWNGSVRQILPSPETVNDVVLYNVLADVDNKDGQLMTGMTTQLFFVQGKAENALVIPSSILMKRVAGADTTEGKAYEIQVMNGRKPEPKTVLIGLSDRTNAQVLSGVNEGDVIVMPAAVVPAGNTQPASNRNRMPRL